jgi:hypothetical protein
MDYVGTPTSNALNGTYSGLPFCGLPLAVLLSLASPSVTIDFTKVSRNIQQPIYEIRMISQVAYQTTNIKLWKAQMTTEFKPKTEFVKKLFLLRRQALGNGMTLLSVDEILAEKHALRGEVN